MRKVALRLLADAALVATALFVSAGTLARMRSASATGSSRASGDRAQRPNETLQLTKGPCLFGGAGLPVGRFAAEPGRQAELSRIAWYAWATTTS